MIESLAKTALDKWGMDIQLDVVTEELAELIQAISKFKRKRKYYTKLPHPYAFQGAYDMEISPEMNRIIEEMVDVEIVLDQLKEIFRGNLPYYRTYLGYKTGQFAKMVHSTSTDNLPNPDNN